MVNMVNGFTKTIIFISIEGLSVLALIFVVFICCWRSWHQWRHQQQLDDHYEHGENSGRLDPEIVNAIPVVEFKETPIAGGEGLECPVCLDEYVGGDNVKVLYGCDHRFHVECVDTWFETRHTCPVCRRNVKVATLLAAAAAAEKLEVVVDVE